MWNQRPLRWQLCNKRFENENPLNKLFSLYCTIHLKSNYIQTPPSHIYFQLARSRSRSRSGETESTATTECRLKSRVISTRKLISGQPKTPRPSALAPAVQVHDSPERLVALPLPLVGVRIPQEYGVIQSDHPGYRPEIRRVAAVEELPFTELKGL